MSDSHSPRRASAGIAVVGMACRYPDAASPGALWENVLAGRRAFRRLPDVRMALSDYLDPSRAGADTTYSSQAAVLRDWTFDRLRFRISAGAFASTDIAHWLALEIADAALQDAGLLDASDEERERVAVVIGNTLTGDHSRANVMRLRWPFVARVVDTALRDGGMDDAARRGMLERMEQRYKAPFPAVDENTLAGALANTIAGRICNAYGFGAGGYSVDAACASSLLSIANACSLLELGDADVVVAGGVDVSLDPFELIGFAKTQALATGEMRVYDRRSNGFLPGEGCGMVVLMRAADARASGRRIHATIRGWGISSDGRGGLTRPEVAGQTKALQRAYARAGFAIDSVTAFEGHGTGTTIGDAVEVNALLGELRAHGATAHASFIGSVKANIGHTKAAAGVAGLIKSVMALAEGVVPPVTACDEPLDTLAAADAPLTIAREPQEWSLASSSAGPRRAAVSAFGFGGINTHVVLETDARPRRTLTAREVMLGASRQDAELFLFSANDREALLAKVEAIARRAPMLSLAELGDVAAVLARDDDGPFRAAIVASTPGQLAEQAHALRVADAPERAPRIGFLFSGQGAPLPHDAGAWQRRFPSLRLDALWSDGRFGEAARQGGTALAQPAIVTASLAALRILQSLGIEASAVAGHSLGELTALHWAGAIDERALLDLAFARGAAMQARAGGRMAALACDAETARTLGDAVVAAINAPGQCVVSGDADVIDAVVTRARDSGIHATRLPVAAAFHSPAMAGAGPAVREAVRRHAPRPLERAVISTVSGKPLPADVEIEELLVAQLTEPVLFADAVRDLARRCELLVEAGPGNVLTGIAASFSGIPVIALEACGDSVRGILEVAGAVFRAGGSIDREALFGDRFVRPIDLEREPVFIESVVERGSAAAAVSAAAEPPHSDLERSLREAIAAKVQLPVDLVTPESRLLRDLHLSSITVANILGEIAASLGLAPLTAPTHFADATIAETARALRELRETGSAVPLREALPAGVAEWVRTFAVTRVAEPLPERLAPPRKRIVVSLLGAEAATATERLLAAANEVRDGETLVIVQDRGRGSGFARSLHLERPGVHVCIINSVSMEHVDHEAARAEGFVEVFYERGQRLVPRLVPHHVKRAMDPIRPDDVILVSGGGKGIAAEAVLHLARRRGASVGIVGRSDPNADAELAKNLERFRRDGIRVQYERADVTDRVAVQRAVNAIRTALGTISIVLHGAGNNEPARIEHLDAARFHETFAPKVDGLRNLLDACEAIALRFVVAFGSVIARTGMRGEAHYAFANEWLAGAVADFGVQHPSCRTLTIEWSVWSGAGMGERLGRVEALRRDGITPLGVDEALAILDSLLGSDASGAVVVAGRLGDVPTLTMRDRELPSLRFLETPRVVAGGVELIADARLAIDSDPYLADHVFDGDALLPAVMGLEAMAQAASALQDLKLPFAFEDVDLRWPIIANNTVRVAALTRHDTVEVVLRSAATQFTVDHFRARIVRRAASEERLTIPETPIAFDVQRDLYATLLFHGERFRRVLSYRALTASGCIAEIDSRGDAWFINHPERLLLGDPGARDAAIHALQACMPLAVVLPAGVASIEMQLPLPEGSVFAHAVERERRAGEFIFDLAITNDEGLVLERWRGLRLRAVKKGPEPAALPPSLWAPWVERRLADLHGVPVRLTIGRDAHSLAHRPDGKPEGGVSKSHAAGLTLIASAPNVACDLEAVVEREAGHWRAILGPALLPLAHTIAAQAGEDFATAATRVWTAHECMQKQRGLPPGSLTLTSADGAGIVTLSSGRDAVTTFVVGDGEGRSLICAVTV